uniref:Uncharacterized protein n=1 Tax=Acanthochromis polyacanthus TaxID=80966 RepID=A0A3Q1G052_9TELE
MSDVRLAAASSIVSKVTGCSSHGYEPPAFVLPPRNILLWFSIGSKPVLIWFSTSSSLVLLWFSAFSLLVLLWLFFKM